MRTVQVAIFTLGVLAFIAAALFTGQQLGDTLWRVGVAAMLIDLASAALWQGGKAV